MGVVGLQKMWSENTNLHYFTATIHNPDYPCFSIIHLLPLVSPDDRQFTVLTSGNFKGLQRHFPSIESKETQAICQHKLRDAETFLRN
jgi:hypothetical protein